MLSTLIGAAKPADQEPVVQRAKARAVVRIVRPAHASAATWQRGHEGAQRVSVTIIDEAGNPRPYRLLEFE